MDRDKFSTVSLMVTIVGVLLVVIVVMVTIVGVLLVPRRER